MPDTNMEKKEWGNKFASEDRSIRARAKKAGMKQKDYEEKVLADGSSYNRRTKKQAMLSKALRQAKEDDDS